MSTTAPSTPLSLEIAARTDPGTLRSLNEDSIATVGELGLLVLSDGMGGYQSGDVASRITTQVIVEGLTQALKDKTHQDDGVAAVCEEVVKQANRAIYLEGENARSASHQPGTGHGLNPGAAAA